MNQELALEKVTVELDLPHEREWCCPSDERTRRTLPNGIRNVKLIGQILTKLRRGGKLAVEFELPRAIKKGLETGEYVRKGGVIVTSEGHKVVHWLKEARAVRIGKAINVLTVLVEIWSEYVLNEKLKQIQVQLDRIEDLVKAQYYSTFLDAHSSLKAAIEATNPEYQTTLLRESRSLFQTARNKTRILISEKIRKVDDQFRRFDEAWFDNRTEIKAIYSLLREIAGHAESAIHCYRAEARILERLGEFSLATRISTEGMDFQLDVHQFLTFFTEGNVTYSSLELLREANLNPQGADQGAIHERAKAVTDVLFPANCNLLKLFGVGLVAKAVTDVLFPANGGIVLFPANGGIVLFKEHRQLRDSILALERRVPIGVFELLE